MSGSNWSAELTLQFIELYKGEEVLWNPNHPEKKHRQAVADAWERIALVFNGEYSVEALKRKKESLMASYRLNKRKPDADWFCFAQLDSYLGPIYEEWKDHPPPPKRRSEYKTSESRKQLKSIEFTRPAKLSSTPSFKTPIPSTTDHDSSEEFELYCQLLVKRLKNLNGQQREIAMHEIDNVIYRVRSQDFADQKPHFISFSHVKPKRSNKGSVDYTDVDYLEEDPVSMKQNPSDDEDDDDDDA